MPLHLFGKGRSAGCHTLPTKTEKRACLTAHPLYIQSNIHIGMNALLHLADNADFRGIDEVHNVANLSAVGHLTFYLQHSVEHACLPMKHQTIGIGDVLLYFIIATVSHY